MTDTQLNMPARGLSVTDFTVLGIVWRDGPCTTYTVMVELAASPSSFYRRRASSTYSIVQKLTDLGFVEAPEEDPGPRQERPIRLTDAGLQTLRRWLSVVPPVEAAHSNDLIRLRANFLGILSAKQQRAFIDQALKELTDLLENMERSAPPPSDRDRFITRRGLIHETRARIAWLEEVRAFLAEKENGGVSSTSSA